MYIQTNFIKMFGLFKENKKIQEIVLIKDENLLKDFFTKVIEKLEMGQEHYSKYYEHEINFMKKKESDDKFENEIKEIKFLRDNCINIEMIIDKIYMKNGIDKKRIVNGYYCVNKDALKIDHERINKFQNKIVEINDEKKKLPPGDVPLNWIKDDLGQISVQIDEIDKNYQTIESQIEKQPSKELIEKYNKIKKFVPLYNRVLNVYNEINIMSVEGDANPDLKGEFAKGNLFFQRNANQINDYIEKLDAEKIKNYYSTLHEYETQSEIFFNIISVIEKNDLFLLKNYFDTKEIILFFYNKKKVIDFYLENLGKRLDLEKIRQLEEIQNQITESANKEESRTSEGGNKKHNKNIEKMYKIGKRYKLLSKNSYHMSGTPYAETRVFDGMDDGHYVFYMPSNHKIRYKYKPGLWIIKPCSSIKTKKDKCRKFRRTRKMRN
jgi:hypothetical protein